MKQMKKIVTIAAMVMGLVFTVNQSKAQTKIGYVSSDELIRSMPEIKKLDSALNDFQNALQQQFEDMRNEFMEQDSLLKSKDTVKYTRAQLELKRRSLGEIYQKLTGWNQQGQQMLQAKQQELLAPIQKKAIEAIQAVAKENGYTYVFDKTGLIVSPPAEDLLPLAKKKLGIK
jgi:outer membrane protein